MVRSLPGFPPRIAKMAAEVRRSRREKFSKTGKSLRLEVSQTRGLRLEVSQT